VRKKNVSLVIGSSLNAGFISGSPRYNYGKENFKIPGPAIEKHRPPHPPLADSACRPMPRDRCVKLRCSKILTVYRMRAAFSPCQRSLMGSDLNGSDVPLFKCVG